MCLDYSSSAIKWAFRLIILLFIYSSFFSLFFVYYNILPFSIFAASSRPIISCYLCFSYSWIRQSIQRTCNSVMQNAWTFFLWMVHEMFPSSSSNLWCPSVVNYILNSSGDSPTNNSSERLPSLRPINFSCFYSLLGKIKSGLLFTADFLFLILGLNGPSAISFKGEFTTDREAAIAILRRA